MSAADSAPFHATLADGPAGAAHWVRAADGTRLRIAHFPEGRAGTVLLFPGRTEYCEKYGPAAEDLRRRGYAMATIDWRGQGLSDRNGTRPGVGHIVDFADFQKDVAALASHVTALGLQRPWFLIAHSMGGAIGLRALHEGLAVKAAVFTAPMWGIRIHPAARPLAHMIAGLGLRLGQGDRQMPFTSTRSYVEEAPFEDNLLTTDPEMYAWMRHHAVAVPELALGGPSIAWLATALIDLRRLMALPAPAQPCLTFLGSDEAIVSTRAIRRRLMTWPGSRLEIVEGARHEVMMEGPATRARVFDAAAGLFRAHS